MPPARVLEELERRGLVTKTKRRNQRDTTPEGHKLAWDWHPPSKFTPAIERAEERGIHNEGFAEIPCSIWRFTADEEEMFEEARHRRRLARRVRGRPPARRVAKTAGQAQGCGSEAAQGEEDGRALVRAGEARGKSPTCRGQLLGGRRFARWRSQGARPPASVGIRRFAWNASSAVLP